MRPEYTVVVVDDEPEIVRIIADSFKRHGAVALTASNGHEALRLVKENKVDVVVSDVRMPRMTGLELLGKLREAHHAHPVFALMSGYADMTLDEVFDLGAAALFAKPVSPKVLVDEIVAILAAIDSQWAEPPSIAPVSTIQMRLGSLDQARAGKALAFGHGGFFLEAGHGATGLQREVKRDELVAFCVEFDEGPLKRLKGAGIARWIRRGRPGDAARPGYGVELRSLEADCRGAVVDMINSGRSRAFIPR